MFKLSQMMDLLTAQPCGNNVPTYYYVSNWTTAAGCLHIMEEKKTKFRTMYRTNLMKKPLNGHKNDGYLISNKETAHRSKGAFSPLSSQTSLQWVLREALNFG